MVHHPSFLYHFLNALYDLDADKAVGEHKSEEDAFGFQIVLLVFNRLLPLLFRPLTLPLQVAFSHQLIVFRFEVGRADVFRAVRVLAKMTQEVNGVAPYGAVRNGVTVADANLDGCPIPSHIKGTTDIMPQHGILPCFQECFGSAVGKDSREKVVRQYVVVFAIEAVAFQFGNETLSGISADGVYIVCTEFVVLAYLHVAVFRPLVIIQH